MIPFTTAKELEAMNIEPPKEIVKGVITAGLNILAGNPKAGKSFLALGLALSVSNGTPAFGQYATRQAGVLYLALEDTQFRLKSRLKGLHQPATDQLRFATYCPKLSVGGLEAMNEALDEYDDTQLLIIDTMGKIADGKSGNDVYGEDYAMTGALQSLANQHDIAVVAVHHTRKQAAGDFLHMVSGSSGITGSADTVSVLTRKRKETTANLEITGRDIHEASVELRWDSLNGGWVGAGYDSRQYRRAG